jgi:internalin A
VRETIFLKGFLGVFAEVGVGWCILVGSIVEMSVMAVKPWIGAGLIVGFWCWGGVVLAAPGKSSVKSPQKPRQAVVRTEATAKTFLDWCLLPEKSAVVKSTVEAVFRAVGTKRCSQAAAKVEKLEKLNLTGMGARDLRPIAGLGNLTGLILDRNPVRDLEPLVGLKRLEVLSLNGSSVKDLKPLMRLGGLKGLAIDGTFVRDLAPVASLGGLVEFSAQGNRLQNIAPLAGLKNLRYLALSRNLIDELTPLTWLSELEELYLNDNKVRDVKPISGLTVLRVLTLNNNKIELFEPLTSLPSLKRVELLGMPTKINPCPAMPKRSVCLYHHIPSEVEEGQEAPKPVSKPELKKPETEPIEPAKS